jgi:hypothetical protein
VCFVNAKASLKQLLVPARRGLRANWLPGLCLQAFALAVVISYFESDTVKRFLNRIGEMKWEYGYLYSSVATALFGGVIPFTVLVLSKKIAKDRAQLELLFYLGFWFWKGAEIDALYRFQGFCFGQGNEPHVIAAKVLVDQLVYNPLWGAPTQALFFLWKDSGFSFEEAKKRLRSRSLKTRVLEVLVSTWIVWIPAVCIIYTLPATLQIPLFNLVLCFWCLLLTFVSRSADANGIVPKSPNRETGVRGRCRGRR